MSKIPILQLHRDGNKERHPYVVIFTAKKKYILSLLSFFSSLTNSAKYGQIIRNNYYYMFNTKVL